MKKLNLTRHGLGKSRYDVESSDRVHVGIATDNTICGKFSWGKISGGARSSTNPLTLTVSGNTVNSGLSTFPRVQRRAAGLRETGAIKDST